MKQPIALAVAFVAGIALAPVVRPAAADGPLVPGASQRLPDEATLVNDRLLALERDVKKLKADLADHRHAYQYVAPRVSQYMSIGELRDAMQPHSTTDITVNWIPLYVSTGQPPAGGQLVNSYTSTPTAAP